MFQAVKELLKTFTRNDTKLGGDAGFTAILHTHARNLDYHPHIHVIVPAASINRITLLWRVKSGKYLFNHTALAQVFRAKVLHGLRQENLCPPHNNPQQWVVDCKHVGTGEKALVYLGRYLLLILTLNAQHLSEYLTSDIRIFCRRPPRACVA
jgi:hypothetical protein